MLNELKFIKLHPDAIIPKYQTEESSGFDFHVIIDNSTKSICLNPKSQILIRTGLSCLIPKGHEIQIRPKSGLALKNLLTITNSPGTIDSDYVYPNEIKIIIYNLGEQKYIIKNKQRIAQGVFSPVLQAKIVEVDEIKKEDTIKNRKGGFGSTGLK